ncbi:MAG: TetR/AcrR family transcriptional regulator [Acidimicrobiales bacterium]
MPAPGKRLHAPTVSTRRRVIDAALVAFARRGYDVTSLDSLAAELGITKQTILYYFPSKEALLEVVVDDVAADVYAALMDAQVDGGAWQKVRGVVRSVFSIAGRRPELLGLVREVARLGPPAATRLAGHLSPLIDKATAYLELAMDLGELRRQDARLLLLTSYSTVVGMVTEGEVLRTLGLDSSARSLVRQRSAALSFLQAALTPACTGSSAA